MKNILFLIDSLGGGGAEHALVNLLHEMKENGYYPTVLTLYNSGVYIEEVRKLAKYRSLNIPHIRGINYIYKVIPARLLHTLLVKNHYDVEIAFLEGISSKIISGGDGSIRKVAWVRTDVEKYKKNEICYFSRRTLKNSYKRMDYIVFLGVEAKNSFIRRYGVYRNFRVIKNIFKFGDIVLRSQEKAQLRVKYTPIIGSVGRLTEVKGYDRLLRTHIRLKREGYLHTIVVLGDGVLKDRLLEDICKYGVQDSFLLLGYKSNPYKYFKHFDWFISTSYLEGFSSVIAEAILLDVPVMATETAGSKELLDKNKYGLLVENSEKGVYRGIKKIIVEGPRLMEHYRKAEQTRKSYFDSTKAAEENLRFIKELCK